MKCERMEMEMQLTRAAHARVLPRHKEGRGTGMWDLHTEVVSKKEKTQLTTEPKGRQVEE